MDNRLEKLALARKKLKNHQDKKLITGLPSPELVQNSKDSDEIKKDLFITGNENEHYMNKSVNLEIDKKLNNIDTAEFLNLQSYNTQLKQNNEAIVRENFDLQQKLKNVEYELNLLRNNLSMVNGELQSKKRFMEDIKCEMKMINEEKINLVEQLEFTKTLLTARENELSSVNNKVEQLENQVEASDLRLKQLNTGVVMSDTGSSDNVYQNAYLQKITFLEEQLKVVQKERDHVNANYEHYVNELNEQLKVAQHSCQRLSMENQDLLLRETSLIDQIGAMEIRLQNFVQHEKKSDTNENDIQNANIEIENWRKKYEKMEGEFQMLLAEHEITKIKMSEISKKLHDLEEVKDNSCENLSLSKLNADITSDKIAAQRASEQNKKLKIDVEELEQAVVKLSQDKLELTEKLSAEKFLNRELTIKLADINERAKDFETKLMAKDDEMIRLLNNNRELEKRIQEQTDSNQSLDDIDIPADQYSKTLISESDSVNNNEHPHNCSTNMAHGDAMIKLQDRFLNIMNEVANLSDEKQRLEHIILQLQNETDTICEYVALYQQQRSLLKKRDAERCAQIEIFQKECERLKKHLNELDAIITKVTEDQELSSYLKNESRHKDIANALQLLHDLKNNTLVSSSQHFTELNNFYPCACCSGNLIDV